MKEYQMAWIKLNTELKSNNLEKECTSGNLEENSLICPHFTLWTVNSNSIYIQMVEMKIAKDLCLYFL